MSSLMTERNKTDSCNQPQQNSMLPGSNFTTSALKTPVSILQEIYVSQGITPKYDLVQIEGKVHEPTFRFRVTVGEVVASGNGNSKKKAKHEAAKNVLKKLKAAQEYFNVDEENRSQSIEDSNDKSQTDIAVPKSSPPSVVKIKLPNLETVLNSSYQDEEEISGDPIGELQELCVLRKMKSPVFDTKSSEGLPHERYFVTDCSILEGRYHESGTGKTKKLAKKKAAAKMLTALRTQPFDLDCSAIDNDTKISINSRNVLTQDDDALAENISRLSKQIKSESNEPLSRLTGSLNDLQPLRIPYKSGIKLKSLQNPSLDLSSSGPGYEDPQEYLKEIAAEQGFKVTYIDVEEKSKSGKYHCFIQATTDPVTVCFGVGEQSAEDAHMDAARNTLEYLRIMTS